MHAAQSVEELIQKYGKLVFHTIYGLTHDWEESQDLTQDTFHQALKGIEAARAASGNQFHEKAWLLGIALNNVRMQQRRRNIFRFIPFSRMTKRKPNERTSETETAFDVLNEDIAPVQPIGYGAKGSSDPADLVAEQDIVQRTMSRLPANLRECLLLSIVGNFSTSEIAQMLNLQEAAVRQRLARARKQFQQVYAVENGEQFSDHETPATTATGKPPSHTDTHQHAQRVESRTTYEEQQDSLLPTRPSILRRNYAEGLS
jgi:RNA polymerase sigma factor (sigma-70 family)